MRVYQILGLSLIAAAMTFLGLSANYYQEDLKVFDKEKEPCGLEHQCGIIPAIPDYPTPMIIGLILVSMGVASFSYPKIKSGIEIK